MKDRSTTIDLLLAFACLFVITITLWPRTNALQSVSVRGEDDQWTLYSLELDDPRLEEIQQRLQSWSEFESDPRYISAKWQLELAEFYCSESFGANHEPVDDQLLSDQPNDEQVSLAGHLEVQDGQADENGPATIQLSDTIATVGFESASNDNVSAEVVDATLQSEHDPIESEPEDLLVAETTPSPTDKDYWESIRASAGATLAEFEVKGQDPPIVMGELLPPRVSQMAFHFAFLIGIAGACCYMHWVNRFPLKRGVPFASQTLPVLARVGTSAGVLVMAFVCALVTWL